MGKLYSLYNTGIVAFDVVSPNYFVLLLLFYTPEIKIDQVLGSVLYQMSTTLLPGVSGMIAFTS